jgi:hypothetical protein
MIELRNDGLTFSFPEVHAEASVTIDFQRTLRIPTRIGATRSRLDSAASRSATWTTSEAGSLPSGASTAG